MSSEKIVAPRQDIRRLALHDLAGQPFGDGRLAHARVAHQKRVVLAPPAQHLDAAFDLVTRAR
jgi:hypothetical protein